MRFFYVTSVYYKDMWTEYKLEYFSSITPEHLTLNNLIEFICISCTNWNVFITNYNSAFFYIFNLRNGYDIRFVNPNKLV